jgi:hypothetical protein
MTPASNNEKVAALKIGLAVAESIRELGEVPSGHLYAPLMGRLSLSAYESIIGVLKNAHLVAESPAHLLTWTGPKLGGAVMTPDGNFNQSREDDLERAAEWQIDRELDPDFGGPGRVPDEFDEYADYDDETADLAPTERNQYEQDREAAMLDLRADDEEFDADLEADYENELACPAERRPENE